MITQNHHSFNKMMEGMNLILAFRGSITQELLASVFTIMDSEVAADAKDQRTRKRIYQILVECLQNVFYHTDAGSKEDASALFMIGKTDEGNYRIITGNTIPDKNVTGLKSKIDMLNGMNAEEVKKHYLEKLSSTELSEKGGAGLGLIEMARKSGHKLEYSFERISETHTFFSLCVTVK